jgi:UDP-glucose 4-epimerase
MKGESPVVFGDGEQSRDFTYVDNVVAANILASEAPEVSGETVNIACGERLSVNSLLELINAALGTEVPPIHAASKPGEILHSIADISKARKILGYTPLVSHREGLERTIAWYKRTAQ